MHNISSVHALMVMMSATASLCAPDVVEDILETLDAGPRDSLREGIVTSMSMDHDGDFRAVVEASASKDGD